MKRWIVALWGVATLVGARPACAQAVAATSVSSLPVKEVTVFKDGHAFVLHQGRSSVAPNGNVLLDQLPSPVMGTFWPFSLEPTGKLNSVVAGAVTLRRDRAAISLRELIRANVGRRVLVTEVTGPPYPATLRGIPADSITPEVRRAGNSDVVLLETDKGTRIVPLERIRDLTVKSDLGTTVSQTEQRPLLTMKLDWGSAPHPKTAEVGMLYLQKGLRWIPSYRVSLDGVGKATVKLQATLVNELADLKNVTANLVIGAPSFALKDQLDPIALQQTAAQLSPLFRTDSASRFGFSNGMMSQVAGGMGGALGGVPGNAPEERVEVDAGNATEDLFVFAVRNVSLKKGERMVLPVAEYSLPYKSVYALDIPFGPPLELNSPGNPTHPTDLTRALAAPKVVHRIRLTNTGPHPLTTAPALLLRAEAGRSEQLLAQAMMTYAAPGAPVDLTVTQALDIRVARSERETSRTPLPEKYRDETLSRVDLAGELTLTSLRREPVEVVVTRTVLGHVLPMEGDGKAEMLNALDGGSANFSLPDWWYGFPWPWWWRHQNGIGQFSWTVRLNPGDSRTLKYQWYYMVP